MRRMKICDIREVRYKDPVAYVMGYFDENDVLVKTTTHYKKWYRELELQENKHPSIEVDINSFLVKHDKELMRK